MGAVEVGGDVEGPAAAEGPGAGGDSSDEGSSTCADHSVNFKIVGIEDAAYNF